MQGRGGAHDTANNGNGRITCTTTCTYLKRIYVQATTGHGCARYEPKRACGEPGKEAGNLLAVSRLHWVMGSTMQGTTYNNLGNGDISNN